ncbi:hypothetical protein BDQ12DRAFT_684689 [Crucibulum laeve]|uniref:Uncharacterized protein n=1 Tax=Crucibulum laeve TaxID=68775 RepID=A0A5C3M0W5_9AGAR|nr:hypothetical protein BDQ12DRAFT_684689 [Crucibulum laeve]
MCACSSGGRERGIVSFMAFFIVTIDCEDDDGGYKLWKVETFIASCKLHGCCKTSSSAACVCRV